MAAVEDRMEQMLRERVLDEIRTQLARYRPLEQAWMPLALIAETSIRLTEGQAGDGYKVVDAQGRPRTKAVGGRTADLTIVDLVAEIREAHPTLFEPIETQPVAHVAADPIHVG